MWGALLQGLGGMGGGGGGGLGSLMGGMSGGGGGGMKSMLGGLMGGLGGSRGQEPYAYQQAPQMTDIGQRQDFTKRTLGFLDGMASGSQPLMSQGQITSQLSGARGRQNADFAAGAQRISERNLGRQGRMGGMAEASLAELERQKMGDSRQLEAGVQNTLASQAPGMRMQAAGMGLDFMGQEQNRFLGEHHLGQASNAARAGFSKKDNILGGMLGGFEKSGGLDWLNSLGGKKKSLGWNTGGATGPGIAGVGPNSGPMVDFIPNGMAGMPRW